MTLEMLAEIVISALLIISGIFGFVGSYGLVKLDDTMRRLHAPTKAATVGVGGTLIASMLYFWWVKGSVSFHELMITIFLFLTAPITANFIAKAHMHRNVKMSELPRSATEYGWAGYHRPPEVVEPIKALPPADKT